MIFYKNPRIMINLKDYIFTFKDFGFFSKKFWKRTHYTDLLGLLSLIMYVFVLGGLYRVSAEPLFFFGFIIAMIYWSLDSRVSIALALVCLVLTPFCLFLFEKNMLFQGEGWAEKLAVWAFYFLVIGVIKQMVELRK